MKLKTIKVNGVQCEISVSDSGTFFCRVAGETVRALTLSELQALLQKATKRPKVTVAVPVSVLGRQFIQPQYQSPRWVSGHSVQHVTLTGIDANGDVRCVDDATGDKGRLDKLGSYRLDLARRLTKAEVQTYTRLATAAHEARQALDAFEATVKIKGRAEELVKEALAAKLDTPEEPPEDSEDPR